MAYDPHYIQQQRIREMVGIGSYNPALTAPGINALGRRRAADKAYTGGGINTAHAIDYLIAQGDETGEAPILSTDRNTIHRNGVERIDRMKAFSQGLNAWDSVASLAKTGPTPGQQVIRGQDVQYNPQEYYSKSLEYGPLLAMMTATWQALIAMDDTYLPSDAFFDQEVYKIPIADQYAYLEHNLTALEWYSQTRGKVVA